MDADEGMCLCFITSNTFPSDKKLADEEEEEEEEDEEEDDY
eukprot:COSAG01_NODE_1365_length_10560_cov_38.008986_1_plen_41_part_00